MFASPFARCVQVVKANGFRLVAKADQLTLTWWGKQTIGPLSDEAKASNDSHQLVKPQYGRERVLTDEQPDRRKFRIVWISPH